MTNTKSPYDVIHVKESVVATGTWELYSWQTTIIYTVLCIQNYKLSTEMPVIRGIVGGL